MIVASATYFRWKKHGTKDLIKTEIETQVQALRAVWAFTKIVFVLLLAFLAVFLIFAIGEIISIIL